MKNTGPQHHRPLARVSRDDHKAFVAGTTTIKAISDRVGCDPGAVSKLFKKWRMTAEANARREGLLDGGIRFRSFDGVLLTTGELAQASEELGLPRLEVTDADIVLLLIAGFVEHVSGGVVIWTYGVVPSVANTQACRIFEVLHNIADDEAEMFSDNDCRAIAAPAPICAPTAA